MNRVDFYVLSEANGRDRFACTIAQKAWQAGNKVYIHTGNREAAVMLDDLLWMFNDISFVPHALDHTPESGDVPVVIGWQDQNSGGFSTLINLTPDIPASADRFDRIVEIVAGDEDERTLARSRYKRYREHGYDLYNHTIGKDYDHT